MNNKTPGQIAYEKDVERQPRYNDGAPRKTWAELGDIERRTWERNPTPRNFMFEAMRVYERIKNSSAFNVPEALSRRKINQHSTLYEFSDGSTLVIYSTRQRAAYWRSKGDCIYGGPVNVNAQGV